MLEIFKYMLVMFHEYNPNDECVGNDTEQADYISEYFYCNLNLLIQNKIIFSGVNVFEI